MPPRHLYIHIPFCARRCSYCDFSIAVRSVTPIDEYVTALRKELGGLHQELEGATLDTVYLGGGTPSRLGGLGIGDVLATVRDRVRISGAPEITIEANPDDVNDMAVAHWVAAGVNRVSLGSRCFADRPRSSDSATRRHREHFPRSDLRAARALGAVVGKRSRSRTRSQAGARVALRPHSRGSDSDCEMG